VNAPIKLSEVVQTIHSERVARIIRELDCGHDVLLPKAPNGAAKVSFHLATRLLVSIGIVVLVATWDAWRERGVFAIAASILAIGFIGHTSWLLVRSLKYHLALSMVDRSVRICERRFRSRTVEFSVDSCESVCTERGRVAIQFVDGTVIRLGTGLAPENVDLLASALLAIVMRHRTRTY
jgi:hypothetical protein